MKQLNFPVKINSLKNELWELLWSEHYFKPGLTLRLQQTEISNFAEGRQRFIERMPLAGQNKRA